MWLVLDKRAFILGTILMLVDAVAFCHIVHPFAFIDVSVCVDKTPLAICLIMTKMPNITISIVPNLIASTFSLMGLSVNLSSVFCFVFWNRDHLFFKYFLIKYLLIIKYKKRQLLFNHFSFLLLSLIFYAQFFFKWLFIR